MKKLTCRDIGVDCDVEFTGETDDEIMLKASDHAKREHNLPVIPPNIETKCRGAICEIESSDAHVNGNAPSNNDDDGNDNNEDEESKEI